MSLICASRREMMTRKIARLMDINVFISHVFDAFLAFKTPQAMGETKKNVCCRLPHPQAEV